MNLTKSRYNSQIPIQIHSLCFTGRNLSQSANKVLLSKLEIGMCVLQLAENNSQSKKKPFFSYPYGKMDESFMGSHIGTHVRSNVGCRMGSYNQEGYWVHSSP